MPISGSIIVINHNNPVKAKKIVKAIREIEKSATYYHVGYSTLIDHFLPQKTNTLEKYMPALYSAISATARCGCDTLVDISITNENDYKKLKNFIQDLDVVWINVGLQTAFVKEILFLENENENENITATHILNYLNSRYDDADAFTRWAPEIAPISSNVKPGKIVLIIGSSSSGKSTLSKKLQHDSNEVFLNVGIDTAVLHYLHLRYLSGVPEHERDESWREPNYNPSEFHKLGCSWIAPGPNEKNPHPHIRFQVGREGRRSISAMYATMAEMSRFGFNVISDHCFHFQNSLEEAKHRFKHLPVVYVSLCPNLETIAAREKQRGDRMIGMGSSVYHQMINDYPADLKIDTGVCSPADASQQILQLINKMD